MRSFEAEGGRKWDVALGRESWGAYFALFVPRDGGSDPRQVMLEVRSAEAANRILTEMDEKSLRELLGRSRPKED